MSVLARLAILAGLVATPPPANASMPSSQRFGAWAVTSLSSLSGVGSNPSGDPHDDGPFFWLSQNGEGAKLMVEWKRTELEVSILVDECSADEEFYQSYEIPYDAYYRSSKRELIDRFKQDFSTWIDQAQFVCEKDEKIKALDLRRLDVAASYFIDRIR